MPNNNLSRKRFLVPSIEVVDEQKDNIDLISRREESENYTKATVVF